MNNDISRGVVLHQGPSAPAFLCNRVRRVFGDASPKARSNFLFGEECVSSNKPVRVTSFTVFERNRVHHAVPVKGVITLYWLE